MRKEAKLGAKRDSILSSVLDPLDAVLDDPNLGLSLDDLVSEQPVVWVGSEFPGPNADVLLLLLQVPLKGAEKWGVLGLYSSPLDVLWPLLEIWVWRGILRLE